MTYNDSIISNKYNQSHCIFVDFIKLEESLELACRRNQVNQPKYQILNPVFSYLSVKHTVASLHLFNFNKKK